MKTKISANESNFREIDVEIAHTHGISNFNIDVWKSQRTYTVSYNTFRSKLKIPINGLKSNKQEIYCPYCRDTIKVKTSSDRVMGNYTIFGFSLMIITLIGCSVFGYFNFGHELGIFNIIGGFVCGIFANLFLIAPWALSLGGEQFEIDEIHGIKEI